MRLKRLEISNYRSLRSVAIEPTPLCVLVGPNAAGKSNFTDALDFLALAYGLGLEKAVEQKGGFESIRFRTSGHPVGSIRFRVVGEVPPFEGLTTDEFQVLDHTFEFRSKPGFGTGAPVLVREELKSSGNLRSEAIQPVYWLRANGKFEIRPRHEELYVYLEAIEQRLAASELLLPKINFVFVGAEGFTGSIGKLGVFQLNPRDCKDLGRAVPNSRLDRSGGNLAAAVAALKEHCPEEYSILLGTVRKIMPSLEKIETDYSHTKTLTLFLHEKGVSRAWRAHEVSDGTIQTIALLAVVLDPRLPLVVIEEPENSVHPWAIRNLVEAFRAASAKKQIFLTTHSPVLIDQLRPEELWVVRRPAGETLIDPVLALDPSLAEAWGKGRFTLSEYLDSGALPEAVPASGS